MNLRQRLSKKLKKNGGFTLIEMLIVVAIIAILVVVSIPMVSSSLDDAKKATDEANLRAAKSVAMVSAMEGKLNGNGAAITGGATVYVYDISEGKIIASGSKDDSDKGQSSANANNYITITFAATTLEPTVKWATVS